MEIAPLYPIALSLSKIPAVVGFTITPMSPRKVRTQINKEIEPCVTEAHIFKIQLV